MGTSDYLVTRAWDDEELFGRSIQDTVIFRHIAEEDHVGLTDMLGGSTLKGSECAVTLTFLITQAISFRAECFALADPDDPSPHLIGLRLIENPVSASPPRSRRPVGPKDKPPLLSKTTLAQ